MATNSGHGRARPRKTFRSWLLGAPARAAFSRRARAGWAIAFAAAFAAAVVFVSAAPPPRAQAAEADTPPADEVMQHLDDLFRAESSEARVAMNIEREEFSRSLTLDTWSLGEDYALAVIRQPAREAGTATLRNPQGLWNYAPRADRLMRIPAGMMSESWMGSHFTNDDMMRETSWEEDYDTSIAWAEEAGERVLRAESTPEPGAPVVWTEVVTYLSEDDWVPIRTEFYDAGDLERTLEYSEAEDIGERRVPTRLEVRPEDDPGERTVLRYENLEFDVDVDRNLFTHRGLRREARR